MARFDGRKIVGVFVGGMSVMLGVVHIYLPYYSNMDGVRMTAAENERSFSSSPESKSGLDRSMKQSNNMWKNMERKG